MSTSDISRDDKVALVFGLTKSQLQPILDKIAGEPVASFEISIEHQKQ